MLWTSLSLCTDDPCSLCWNWTQLSEPRAPTPVSPPQGWCGCCAELCLMDASHCCTLFCGVKQQASYHPWNKSCAPTPYPNQSRLRPAMPRAALLLCPIRGPRHHCNPLVFPARMIPVRPRIPNPGSSVGSEASCNASPTGITTKASVPVLAAQIPVGVAQGPK